MKRYRSLIVATALAFAGCSSDKPATSTQTAPSPSVASNVPADQTAGSPSTVAKPPTAVPGVGTATPVKPADVAKPTVATSAPAKDSTQAGPRAAVKSVTPARVPNGPGLIGNWKGEMKMPPLPPQRDPQSQAMLESVKKMLANPTLQLEANHKFTMTLGVPMLGSWQSSAGRLSLKVETVAGQPMASLQKMVGGQAQGNPMFSVGMSQMAKGMQFAVSADQRTLTAIPLGGAHAQGGLTFHKG